MADDYETIRMLGGGAGGSAYLTRRRCDGQHVVIKRVPLKGLSRSEARYAQSELAVMRSLDAHPFVVRFIVSRVPPPCSPLLLPPLFARVAVPSGKHDVHPAGRRAWCRPRRARAAAVGPGRSARQTTA